MIRHENNVVYRSIKWIVNSYSLLHTESTKMATTLFDKKISQQPEISAIGGQELIPIAFQGNSYFVRPDTILAAMNKERIGLGQVANLSPSNMPISTAVSIELDRKAAFDHTHELTEFPWLQIILNDKVPTSAHQALSNIVSNMLTSMQAMSQQLVNKSEIGHSHTVANITDFVSAVNSLIDSKIASHPLWVDVQW